MKHFLFWLIAILVMMSVHILAENNQTAAVVVAFGDIIRLGLDEIRDAIRDLAKHGDGEW